MPVFLAALLGGLVSAAGSIVGRVLISLGIGYVTYQGLSTAMDYMKNLVWTNLGSLAADILQLVSVLEVDTAINIMFSAVAARLVIRGLTGGAITKMVIK